MHKSYGPLLWCSSIFNLAQTCHYEWTAAWKKWCENSLQNNSKKKITTWVWVNKIIIIFGWTILLLLKFKIFWGILQIKCSYNLTDFIEIGSRERERPTCKPNKKKKIYEFVEGLPVYWTIEEEGVHEKQSLILWFNLVPLTTSEKVKERNKTKTWSHKKVSYESLYHGSV